MEMLPDPQSYDSLEAYLETEGAASSLLRSHTLVFIANIIIYLFILFVTILIMNIAMFISIMYYKT